MENTKITREYLEALSTSRLLKIANDFGVDVFENVLRNDLIAEILDIFNAENESSDEIIFDEDDETEPCLVDEETAVSNSTEVGLVLQNPAWAFIYWNISNGDKIALENAFVSELTIRVNCFSEKNDGKPDEFFDIHISKQDDGQYFLLPNGRKFFRVDLLFNLDGIIDILASSKIFQMPDISPLLSDVYEKKGITVSPMIKLSGIESILVEHYKNNRELFG